MAQYELVTQENEWGCGAACVASLLDVSYQDAKQLVETMKEGEIDEDPCGLELHHLALALQKNGIKVVADWAPERYPDGTIICISGKQPYEGDHYMLKTPAGWMDPWHNVAKTPNKPRKAGYRKRLPNGTFFLVALVPVGR